MAKSCSPSSLSSSFSSFAVSAFFFPANLTLKQRMFFFGWSSPPRGRGGGYSSSSSSFLPPAQTETWLYIHLKYNTPSGRRKEASRVLFAGGQASFSPADLTQRILVVDTTHSLTFFKRVRGRTSRFHTLHKPRHA